MNDNEITISESVLSRDYGYPNHHQWVDYAPKLPPIDTEKEDLKDYIRALRKYIRKHLETCPSKREIMKILKERLPITVVAIPAEDEPEENPQRVIILGDD